MENELTIRVQAEVKKQMLAVDNKLEAQLDNNLLSGLSNKIDKLEQRIDQLKEQDTEEGEDRPSRKRKLGSNGPELDNQIQAMKKFAQSAVTKMSEVDGRLDILELRTTSIEDTHTAVLKLADRFSYNDKIVVKHQAAMLQMRDYLTQHQDFIDGICKTLGITANCGEEPDDEMKEFPIKVIDDLRSRIEVNEPKIVKAMAAFQKIFKELTEMKAYLRRASDLAADWSQCKPGVMHVVNRIDPAINRNVDQAQLSAKQMATQQQQRQQMQQQRQTQEPQHHMNQDQQYIAKQVQARPNTHLQAPQVPSQQHYRQSPAIQMQDQEHGQGLQMIAPKGAPRGFTVEDPHLQQR